MDTKKIKNKASGMMRKLFSRNLNLENTALQRIEGGLIPSLIYQYKLFRKSSSLIRSFKKHKVNIKYAKDSAFAKLMPERERYKISYEIYGTANNHRGKSKVYLENKTYISTKEIFPLYEPSVGKTYDHIQQLKSHFRLNDYDFYKCSILMTKPRIYFDYMSGGFKVEIFIISVETKDSLNKFDRGMAVVEKWMKETKNYHDEKKLDTWSLREMVGDEHFEQLNGKWTPVNLTDEIAELEKQLDYETGYSRKHINNFSDEFERLNRIEAIIEEKKKVVDEQNLQKELEFVSMTVGKELTDEEVNPFT